MTSNPGTEHSNTENVRYRPYRKGKVYKTQTKHQPGLPDFLRLFKVRKKNNILYQNIVFVGLFCLFQIYSELNRLLIPIMDLVYVGFAATVIVTLFFFNFYRKTLSIVWALVHNLSIGAIAALLFIWTNDNLSNQPVVEERLPIEKVDMEYRQQRRSRILKPFILLNVRGKTRKINFARSMAGIVMNSRSAVVSLKEGFWGYCVLTDIKLLEH